MKIAYVTDLHIAPKAQESMSRMTSLALKMSRARSHISALILGGDTFTLEAPSFWPDMLSRKLTDAEVEIRRAYCVGAINEFAPRLLSIASHTPIYMLPGNADVLAYDYMRENASKYPGINFAEDKVTELQGFRIIGTGGMEANNDNAMKVVTFNPWYRGNLEKKAYASRLNAIAQLAGARDKSLMRRTILCTHQPPQGYVDAWKTNHDGSSLVLGFISMYAPLLELSGHVHDNPVGEQGYDFSRAFAVFDKRTLVVNTGGGKNHDDRAGVRGAVIDLEQLGADILHPERSITPF